MEKWNQIVIEEIKTQYEISNKGRCRNTAKLNWKTKGILVPKFNKANGYLSYCIADPNLPKYKYVYAHRLVLLHFTTGDGTLHVNHRDGNKLNNDLENLEWCTQRENMEHATLNELIGKPILQYSLSGQLLGRFKSATDAESFLGITQKALSQSLNSNLINSQSGGYQWRFEDGTKPVQDIRENFKTEKRGLVQLSKSGNLIEEFSHSTLAYEKLGVVDNGYLSRVAQRANNLYKGYRWMYSEDYYSTQP